MDVLLLTDEADRESVLPTLGLFSHAVRYAPLTVSGVVNQERTDAVIVDARVNLAAARRACRRLSSSAPSVAVLAVIAAEDFEAVDIDWRCDDVLLATSGFAELRARLRLAIARRRNELEIDGTLKFGDLVLHPASYAASLPNRDLDLTLTEFKLLNFLVQHAGRAFTRTRLMHEIWEHERCRRTVDVHVQRLRAKLGAEYESIVDTIRGVGYMAVSPPQPRWVAAGSLQSDIGICEAAPSNLPIAQ